LKSLNEWLHDMFVQNTLVSALLSSPRNTVSKPVRKVDVKPIIVKQILLYQFSYFDGSRVTHRNLDGEASIIEITSLLSDTFRLCDMHAASANIHVRVSKSGDTSISVRSLKQLAFVETTPQHDRAKTRILPEGEPIDFLVRLGVMTQDGRVTAAKYDKFKQINRFLEMAADVADRLKPEGTLHIVDFGSGKSYLTFALYYYFTKLRNRAVSIRGLDLKSDVVAFCNAVAHDIGYTDLEFAVGDIAGYTEIDSVDMVVSLHACDTATDDALAKAVVWNASVILAVPCCQHELFHQIRSEVNRPLLKHGILKERIAALVTDALRAEWLECMGYTVQVMEFIETEHTPKNLLIRAVKSNRPAAVRNAAADYAAFRDYWHASPHIDRPQVD